MKHFLVAWLRDRARARWRGAVVAAAVTSGVLLLRAAGLLQLLELAAYDQLVRLRPHRSPDPRIAIIGIAETDLNRYGWPLNDQILAALLRTVQAQEPRAIGLDIYRNLPVEPGHADLLALMESLPNLIGITKVAGQDPSENEFDTSGNARTIAPPPVLAAKGQIGANDMPLDPDGKIRRYFLYLDDSEGNVVLSFGLQLALLYLKSEGIYPNNEGDDPDRIELGQAVLRPLERNDGGYVRVDANGYQLLLNYRGPQGTFAKVSVADVLDGRLPPDYFRDRIVMIGSTATSLKDFYIAPYASRVVGEPENMSGVEIHANFTSWLLDAATGERRRLRVLPQGSEWLWIAAWALMGTSWHARSIWAALRRTSLGTGLASAGLLLAVYLALLQSWWLPGVPALLALWGATLSKSGWLLIQHLRQSYQQLEDYARNLEVKVEQRTHELKVKNDELETALVQVKTAQQQLIAQEKLASLGSLTAGIAHEIRNPLNFVSNFAQIAVEMVDEIDEELAGEAEPAEVIESVQFMLTDFRECTVAIQQNGQRIERIVNSMLMHAREERGSPESLELNPLVENAIQLIYHNRQAQIEAAGVQLETHYDERVGWIEAIPKDLDKSVFCILNNAFDAAIAKQQASDNGYQPCVIASTRDLGDRVEIRVRDNGLGIAADQLDKIFEPFYTNKTSGESTGLSLSLTYDAIVSLHRGELKVDSQLGDYAEFSIILPRQQNLPSPTAVVEPALVSP